MSAWFEELEDGGRCSLCIEGPVEVTTKEEAWALLPEQGEGWVSLTHEVRRFDAENRSGVILDAEVALGSRTVVLRHEGGIWSCWAWEERVGDDVRVVRRRYLSSAPATQGNTPQMEIATYWREQIDEGVDVWQPLGSRFCGWRE